MRRHGVPDLPHPALVCAGPQLDSVIAELEAGTYPPPDGPVWRTDIPAEQAQRLAAATGLLYLIADERGQLAPAYGVLADGTAEPAECWPRTMEGAITATSQAAWLSVATGVPHEVQLPDGRILARYVRGGRADL